jgi:hypothetical protein
MANFSTNFAGYGAVTATSLSVASDVTVGGVVKLADGTIGAPSLSFTSDPDTGIYRSAANYLRTVGGGAYAAEFTGGLTNFNGNTSTGGVAYLSAGSAAAPSLAFAGDTNTGIYNSSADQVGFATNGTHRGYFSDSQLYSAQALSVSGAANLGGGLMYLVTVAPAQITADTNNWATLLGIINRVSSDAARNVTGFSHGTVSGTTKWMINSGSFNITLKHEDGASTAANRILSSTGADLVLVPGGMAMITYDSAAGRWRTFLI